MSTGVSGRIEVADLGDQGVFIRVGPAERRAARRALRSSQR